MNYDNASNKLSWPASSQSCHYEIFINNEKFITDTNSLIHTIEPQTNYEIKIRAIGLDNNTVDSPYSSVINLRIGKLVNPTVTVTNAKAKDTYSLTVNPVIGATSYEAIIKQYNSEALISNKTLTSASINNADIVAKDGMTRIEILVKALDSTNNNLESDVTKHVITPKQIDTPLLTFNKNGRLEWSNPTPNGYMSLTINDVAYKVNDNYFDLDSLGGSTKEFTIKSQFISRDNRYLNSEYSKQIVATKLDAPTNVTYDKATSTIKWNSVPNASKYRVVINGTEYFSSKNELIFNNFTSGINNVEIYSVGEGNYITSNKSTITLNKLSNPTNIAYDETTSMLTWDNVNPGCKYKITINGEEHIVDTNQFNITLDLSGTANVSVQSISSDNNTIASDIISINDMLSKYLSTPNGTLTEGIYSNTYNINLENVNNATNYKVVVSQYKDGEMYISYDYDLTASSTKFTSKEITIESGVNKIEVSVVAKDSTNTYKDSKPLILTVTK